MKTPILKAALFLLFMFGLTLPVKAVYSDVSCFVGDCLTFGWEETDFRTSTFDFISCYNSDCRRQGWLEYRADGSVYEYRCLDGGCFVEGYEVIDLFTGSKLAEVSCMANDCHRIGWIEKPVNEKYVYVTLCKNQECGQRGWTTRWRGLITADTTCKTGGCFVNGWTDNFGQ